MGKSIHHAESSAKKFGGTREDYLDIHLFLDQSRNLFPDVRHRAVTHTSWFITEILPLKFGHTRSNSEGKEYSVVEVGEQHVLEDYGGSFIPSVQDFLQNLTRQDWMNNAQDGSLPPSRADHSKELDMSDGSSVLDGPSFDFDRGFKVD